MKTACTIQCRECPFRRNSLPGWLGDYTPATVFRSMWHGLPFYCHPKIKYSDPKWAEKADKNGKLCLGGMVFAKKMMAPLRPDAYPETDKEVILARYANQDRTDVDCMEVKEFMAWHAPENMSENMARKIKSA